VQVPPPECSGGVAEFRQAESLEHLLTRADAVVKGRLVDWSGRTDKFGIENDPPHVYNHRFTVFEVEVLDVLVGEIRGETITLGMSFGEVCRAVTMGDEYYLFMGQNREFGESYLDNPTSFDNPAEYGLRRFGYQNVFAVQSGIINQLEGLGSRIFAQYDGMPEESFRNAILEAAARSR
jgi:hypothetical protein